MAPQLKRDPLGSDVPAMISLLVQGRVGNYIVRPPWLVMLLGVAIMGGLYSMALAGIRRAVGNIGLVALAAFVAIVFALAVAQAPKDGSDVTSFELWLTTAVCILAFAVAPAMVVWRKNRAGPTRFWPQVGWAVVSIYATFIVGGLVFIFTLMIQRRLPG